MALIPSAQTPTLCHPERSRGIPVQYNEPCGLREFSRNRFSRAARTDHAADRRSHENVCAINIAAFDQSIGFGVGFPMTRCHSQLSCGQCARLLHFSCVQSLLKANIVNEQIELARS